MGRGSIEAAVQARGLEGERLRTAMEGAEQDVLVQVREPLLCRVLCERAIPDRDQDGRERHCLVFNDDDLEAVLEHGLVNPALERGLLSLDRACRQRGEEQDRRSEKA